MKIFKPSSFIIPICPLIKGPALAVLILCCLLTMAMAQGNSKNQNLLERKITIRLQNEPLISALEKITAASGVKFTFNEEVANSKVKVSLESKNKSLRQVLTQALASGPFIFSVLDKEVFIRIDPSKVKKSVAGLAYPANEEDERYAIRGAITSQQTGETIIAATIRVTGLSIGTVSNEYGFYSLTLPRGKYQLAVSAVGQKSSIIEVDLDKDKLQNIALEDQNTELQTVNIVAGESSGRDIENPQMGIERVNVKEIKNVPVVLGERDVLKSIQLLPGIKSSGDGTGGFFVRGGSAGQNMILLDEAPVYNAYHMLGLFSTFNSDAIKNVTVYKGGMPAEYGGALSSIMDIKMNEGNNRNFGVSGGIGMIASRLNVEGPIQKDKSSFLISARRTYADMFFKFSRDTFVNRNRLYFYDVNAKANYILSDKDRLYISGYFGKDVIGFQKLIGVDWGNATGTLRWNHIHNNRLFSNTSLIFSNYKLKITMHMDDNNYDVYSKIRDWNLKKDFQWYINDKNTLRFGFNSIYHTIKPGEVSVGGVPNADATFLQNRYAANYAMYAGNNWKAGEHFSLTYGARLSAFSILGPGDYYQVDAAGNVTGTRSYKKGQIVKTYLNLEPRIAAALKLNEQNSFKASYVRNVQNLHLISEPGPSSPTDKWVASTNLIKPEIADQVSAGYYKNTELNKYEFTVEAYYKHMKNQIDYRNGVNLYTNQPIETQLLYGKGRAYGVEFMARKNSGNLTGWISYTLSKAERKINGINDNRWYNARQDRTHDIAVVGIYQLNKKWNLSANWIFSTGDAVTFPTGKYQVDGEDFFSYADRNALHMPNIHRLDIGATRQLIQNKKFSSELTFSLYNVYGHNNAYQVYFRNNKANQNRTEAVGTTVFKYIPSIAYNFKF